MSRLAVVVPVKARGHKKRLSPRISAADRAKLAGYLLDDTLSVLESAGLVKRTFVVSSDLRALGRAAAAGAKTIREARDAGVNAAVEAALSNLGDYGEFLIIPTDLPMLSRTDLKRAVGMKEAGADVVIGPSSSFNGTNLLLFSRGKGPELSYDRDSFWHHLKSSAERGYKVAVVGGRGLMTDVDEPRDVSKVLASRINRRSLRFLKSL